MILSGKNAIVTGASQGLGEAIAEKFVAEGASVFLCARSADAIAAVAARLSARCAPGQSVHSQPVDISKRPDVDGLIAAAQNVFGTIDVLVNNAGIYGPIGLTHEVDWDEWVEAIHINLMGLVYACRVVTPVMIAQKHGKIVNVSGGGATSPMPRLTSYAASKAAAVRFTESLALELKEYGIAVNAIAPGALATRLLDQVVEAGADKVGTDFHARMIRIREEGGTPLSTGAALAAYLASDESAGITGRLISAVWDPWQDMQHRASDLEPTDIYTLRRIVPADRGRDWDKK